MRNRLESVNGPKNQELWKRADHVIPGGNIYLTRSARLAGADVQPGFIEKAEGCRVTDVDGHSYIDFACANGPNLLGYRHPEVEAAVVEQAAVMDGASYFPPALVELAEALVKRNPAMDWAIPAKNGSDVVELGLRVARAATGREKIVRFVGAYHGFAPELVPGGRGVARSTRKEVVKTGWNDVEGLKDAFLHNKDDIAAIVMNPLDQSGGIDTTKASPRFCQAIGTLCRENKTVLVFDDVRAGFRMHPMGSHIPLGLEPDLVCIGKALGNGYPVSVLLGTHDLRDAAGLLMFTASFIFGAQALRAAITVLKIYERDGVFDSLVRSGERLRKGILQAAAKTGHPVRYTGPVTMPTLLFDGDDNALSKGKRFSQEAAKRGVLFHPVLNWFVCLAHDSAAIDEAVRVAEEALDAI